MRVKKIGFYFGVLILFFLVSCDAYKTQGNNEISSNTNAPSNAQLSLSNLTVYKSATCGCCKDWVNHLEDSYFTVESINKENMNEIKDQFEVPVSKRSCHTAVSAQGYVFEGHIPARFIHKFLENPPEDAIGLSVPAMPVGSPGMELGERFSPYPIFLMNKDGSETIVANIQTQEEQYKK